MQRISRDLARKFAFDWRDEPLLRVVPGEPFENVYQMCRIRNLRPVAGAEIPKTYLLGAI